MKRDIHACVYSTRRQGTDIVAYSARFIFIYFFLFSNNIPIYCFCYWYESIKFLFFNMTNLDFGRCVCRPQSYLFSIISHAKENVCFADLYIFCGRVPIERITGNDLVL